MIPSFYVRLDQFPITPNGKLDHKALPAPEGSEIHQTYIGPRNATQAAIIKIWEDILKIDHVGIQDNFFDLGGHSLLVTRLASHMKKTFGIDIKLSDFFSHPTISMLASLVDAKGEKMSDPFKLLSKKDLQDARLISPESALAPLSLEPQNVLLTGATGFLGSILLAELISQTTSNIYCLIRANDENFARIHLEQTLKKFGLFEQIDFARVRIVPGDIASPQLGVEKKQYEDLSYKIDTICHCGAYVHHLYDYSHLRPANVLSTIELIKLASRHQTKHIHFISTLAAVIDQENGIFTESFPQKEPIGTEGGYVLSKWVSEKILAEASQRGFITSIYRPPQIVGQSKTGISPTENSHFMMLIKGCIQMGYAPDNLQPWPLMAVDDVAKIIVQGIIHSDFSNSKVFNLAPASSPSFNDIFTWLNTAGYPVKLTPIEEWRNEHLSKIDEYNAFYPLSSLYLSGENTVATTQDGNLAIYKTDNQSDLLKKAHRQLTTINKDMFSRYIHYLSQDFLKN